MNERVWVVLDKLVNDSGTSFVEKPLLGTVAYFRRESIARYKDNLGGAWVTSGSYTKDRENGYVRCVRATLTLEQPKSKPRKP